MEKVKNIHVDSCETLISYDVSPLFMSIPVDKALDVVKQLLISDDIWKKPISGRGSSTLLARFLSADHIF